jgi:hypothetical protein
MAASKCCMKGSVQAVAYAKPMSAGSFMCRFHEALTRIFGRRLGSRNLLSESDIELF